MIDAAQATFNEVAEPPMGMVTMTSHSSLKAALSPHVSLPTRRTVGLLKSCSAMSVVALALLPTIWNGPMVRRIVSNQGRRSAGPGTRTTGTAKNEPVVALIVSGL